MQELHDLPFDKSMVVGVAVSHESIERVAFNNKDESVWVGAQSCSSFISGSYTGGVSAASLKEIGSQFVFVGHSERRRFFKESNEQIACQVECALKSGLKVVLCIGESLQERERGTSLLFLENQIKAALQKVCPAQCKDSILLAYEPEYAVGTGILPSADDIRETMAGLQNIKNKASLKLEEVPLLYGGSINEKNYKAVAEIPYVEGFLIGKASLDIQSFKKIVAGCKLITKKYASSINKNYKVMEKI